MFEIYFNDLKPEVQDELLAYMGVSNAGELNWDIMPLMVIEPADKEPNSGFEDIEVMAEMKEMQNLVENFFIGI